MKLKSHKDLIVWQKSIQLVDIIYKLTAQLPKSEMYGLVSQMQRAATAIPSNIAEGYNRNHRGEYVQFLGIANASAAELETQLIISTKQYPSDEYEKTLSLLNEIQKMLHSLLKNLRRYV